MGIFVFPQTWGETITRGMRIFKPSCLSQLCPSHRHNLCVQSAYCGQTSSGPVCYSTAECRTSRFSAARPIRTWRRGSWIGWESTWAKWSRRNSATSKLGECRFRADAMPNWCFFAVSRGCCPTLPPFVAIQFPFVGTSLILVFFKCGNRRVRARRRCLHCSVRQRWGER